jgi:type IV fimbrial biogenesis protein FimT
MNKETGFTLIELMVVIAVIAIAGGIGAISLSKYAPDYRLYSAVRELESTLQQARLLSVKLRVPVAVSFDIASDTFQVFTDNGPTWGVLESGAGETILKTVGKYPGVDFYAAAMGPVQFNPRGFVTMGVGDCYFKNILNTYRGVRLTLAGNSRIIKSGDAGSHWQ